MDTARSLWTTAPGQMALRTEDLPALSDGQVRLRALCSGVSRGTEALVLAGDVPETLHATMRCPGQAGDFPFPVKYGYALVGEVEDGPFDRLGQTVFTLHPHQDHAVVPASMAVPLPEGLPPLRAVLTANMETALNLCWDSGAAPGDRVLVVGAGVVGLLVAGLIRDIPGTSVVLCDINPARRTVAEALGLPFALPEAVPQDIDIAINLSASGSGLQTALDAAGQEATVVEGSWYGSRATSLHLGGGFHPRRLTLKSSQVGHLPPGRAPRWSFTRRLQTAMALLRDRPALDLLVRQTLPFAQAPERLPPLLAPGADALCPVLIYPETGA
ncbi:zinc-binding alcohol dehydrogenase [Meridianimarinicoccus sp. MJW13]|uniref:zinc-dependent alcohol dehydrogenase n=1 Tax=Meridianimarinicoccus sp. MJW13 TaxID=2720031 RepID=UPI001D01E928|nr:zinc-binding alcohol dehydrogenase [Fluviibacterium sp. MJW13]